MLGNRIRLKQFSSNAQAMHYQVGNKNSRSSTGKKTQPKAKCPTLWRRFVDFAECVFNVFRHRSHSFILFYCL